MTIESGSWASVFGLGNEKTKYGWDIFVKNDWTKFAEENGLTLTHQKVRSVAHKKNSIKHRCGSSPSLPIEKFAESPWVEWFEKRTLPSTDWTISQYKEKFKLTYLLNQIKLSII